MNIKFKPMLLIVFILTLICLLPASAAEMGEITDFEVVAQSDTVVSVKYDIKADSAEKEKQKKATVRAYVDGEQAWSITFGSTDSNHTSIAVLKNLKPDTSYTLTMQMTYSDGTTAKMSEPFVFSTLPDQSKTMGLNIAYGKEVYADSKITNAFGYELITNGFSGYSYSAYDNWSSANDNTEHWAYIDLNKESYFDKIVVKFYGASKPTETTYPYALDFNLEASNDALNWVSLKKVTDNDTAVYECEFDDIKKYRYVKIVLKKAPGTQVRFRISELEVYSAKGLEEVLPHSIGYTMGINQVIDQYTPKAILNDGTEVSLEECEYTLTSSDSSVISVDGSKVTASGLGTAELEICLKYNGFSKTIKEQITVSNMAFSEACVKTASDKTLENLSPTLTVHGTVSAVNYGTDDHKLLAIVACYDENGRMVAVAATDTVPVSENGGKADISTDEIILPDDVSGCSLRLHLIDSIDSLKAHIISVEYLEE